MVRMADSFRYVFENIARSIRSLRANAPVASLRVQAQRRSGASGCRRGMGGSPKRRRSGALTRSLASRPSQSGWSVDPGGFARTAADDPARWRAVRSSNPDTLTSLAFFFSSTLLRDPGIIPLGRPRETAQRIGADCKRRIEDIFVFRRF